jgi:hypothetical protein
MPFALVFIGLILVVTGIRDTYKQLGNMVVADMTGKNGGAGFIMFAAAIGMTGALGAIPQLRTFSHYFLALILISILLSNTGAMQKFIAALKGARAQTPVNAPSATGPAGTGTSSGTGLFPGIPNIGITLPRTGQTASG